MKFNLVLALALFSSLAGAQEAPPAADVATVTAVSGEVMLAQGARIAPAEKGARLKTGDRLMTMNHAEVQIAFPDGCSQRLNSNSVLTIGDSSDCRKGILQPRSFGQAIGDSGGQVAKSAGMTAGQKTAVTAAVLIPLLWWWDRNRDDDGREPVSR